MPSEKILAGPVEIFLAAAGTAAVDVTANPGSAWTRLGEDFFTEDGVRFAQTEVLEEEYVLKSTLAQDVHRTQETNSISVDIKDATLETRALLTGVAVTRVARGSGQIGTSQIPLHRGFAVQKHALLLRGLPPYAVSTPAIGDLIYYLPRVYVLSVGEISKMKTAEVLPVVFRVLEHSTLQAGYIKSKTADST